MPRISVRDFDMYYEMHGEGEPLLLISGLGSDSQSWMPILKSLTERYQVIIFDNRGIGRSEDPGSALTIETLAEDCCRLTAQLGLSKVNILGHSMGGFIAMTFALMYPEKCGKLVLAATTSEISEKAECLFGHWIKLRENKEVSPEQWFMSFFFWLFTDGFFRDTKKLENSLRFAVEYPYPQTLSSFRAQVGAMVRYNITARLGEIQNDSLILAGEDDILIKPHQSEIICEKIGGCSAFCKIPGAAHSVFLEQPDRFCREVNRFLS